jgi:tetratricopeptide (TPR) repeat protein
MRDRAKGRVSAGQGKRGAQRHAGFGVARAMILAFTIALLVRIIYVLSLRASPFFGGLLVDAQWHDQWAWDWARGAWSMGGRAFFRAPLYPFFLSLIYRVFGHSLMAARAVQVVVGASTAAALAGCGWRIGGWRPALWAGIMAALYGPLVFFDGELLTAGLLVALLAWSLYFLLGRPAARTYIPATLFLGLAVVVRPNVIVLLPLFLYYAWAGVGRAGVVWRGVARGSLARAGMVAAIGFVALVPGLVVTVINARAEKGIVFVASQGGVNFYAGNHAGADGQTIDIPEMQDSQAGWGNFVDASREAAEAAEGRPLDSAEVSRYWYRRGFDWIRSEPAAAAALTLKKVYFAVNAYEIPNNRDLYFDRPDPLNLLLWKLPFFAFPWGIVFPLAVAGACLGLRLRESRRTIGMLTAWGLVLGIFLVPFFVNARFRLDIVPVLILLAAFALSHGRRLLRGLPAAFGIGALILVNTSFFHVRLQNPAETNAKLAMALIMDNRLVEGRRALETALRYDPTSADYTYLLGYVCSLEGRNDEALAYYERTLRMRPKNYKVLSHIGGALLQMGRRDEAREALERAAELAPSDGDIRLKLGRVYESEGRIDEAFDSYRRAIAAMPGNAEGYLDLGYLYQKQGDLDSAVEAWRLGVQRDPNSFDLRFNLALAYAHRGQLELGYAQIEAAVRIKPGNAQALGLRDWFRQQGVR